MTIIEQIKAEIERRIYEISHPLKDGYEVQSIGKIEGLSELLDFLDTLESEKPVERLEEELEKEINKAMKSDLCPEEISNYDFRCIARHFAEWQYQKDRGKFAEIKAKTWCEGFDACKEQMMKEAVEGKIIFLLNGDVAVNIGDTDEYKLGQKVRIIIVKE